MLKRIIHLLIAALTFWLSSIIVPSHIKFTGVVAFAITVLAYMAAYELFNIVFAKYVTKHDLPDTWGSLWVFMFLEMIPGFIALLIVASVFGGFWASSSLAIALMSVCCEIIHLVSVFIQEW